MNMRFVVTALSHEDGIHRYIVGETSFPTESKANDFAKITSSYLIGVDVEKYCPYCHRVLSQCVCEDE